jgi:hypothetical protein
VGGEEFVHDSVAILSGDGAQSGQACERQGSDELAHREFEV